MPIEFASPFKYKDSTPPRLFKQNSKESQQGFKIDQFHSIPLLHQDLQRLREQGATQTNIEFYLKRDVETFLLENAMQSPYHFLQYYQEGSDIYFPGNPRPVAERYRHAAEYGTGMSYDQISTLPLAEVQKLQRNAVDAVAWDRELSQFFQGDFNYAFQISPPSIGENGFGTDVYLNVFEKNGVDIKVHLFVIPGETGGYELSQQLEQKLQSLLPKYSYFSEQSPEQLELNEKRFLLQPIRTKAAEGFDLPAFLVEAGIDTRKMTLGKEYEKILQSDQFIQFHIDRYIGAMVQLSDSPSVGIEEQSLIQSTILTPLFNRAVELKAQYMQGNQTELIVVREPMFDSQAAREIYFMSLLQQYNQEVRITEGSCPVVSPSKQMDRVMERSGGILNYSAETELNKILQAKSVFDFKKNEKWEFNKDGDCQKCKQNSKDVGQLGPCKVCKKCQEKFDSGEYS